MRQEKILLLEEDATRRAEHRQYLQELGQVLDSDLNSDPKTWKESPTLLVASMPVTRGKERQLIKSLMALPNRPFSLFLLEANKARQATEALELGADEIMRPPFAGRELCTRLQLLANRRRREHLGRPDTPGEGQLSEISVRELIELFAEGKGTASVHLHSGSDRARLVFMEGQLIAATLDHRQGMEALVRLLRWNDGHFESSPELPDDDNGILEREDPLKHALTILAQWDKNLAGLPPLHQHVQVRFLQVQNNLDSLSNLAEQLLWQLASHRSIGQLIDSFDGDLSEALKELQDLYAKDYFHPSETASESINTIGFGDSGAALAGLANRSQEMIDVHNSNFNNQLANAAQEAGAQLMAVAKPVEHPVDPANRDEYPSFLELPLPSAPNLPSASSAHADNRSSNTLDSLFGPSVEMEINLPISPSSMEMSNESGDILGAEVASNATLTDISPSFELDDFKSLSNKPLPTEDNDIWNVSNLSSPMEHGAPATTRTNLTASPQSIEDLLESSASLTDTPAAEDDHVFLAQDDHLTLSAMATQEDAVHTLSSVPAFSDEDSSSLPTGEFDSIVGQDAPFDLPDSSDQPNDGDTVTFSVGDDGNSKAEKFLTLSQDNATEQKDLSKMTLPLMGIVPSPFSSGQEQESSAADTIIASQDAPDSDGIDQLLRAETLDILGKLVQTELSGSQNHLPAVDKPLPTATSLALGPSTSHEGLTSPTVNEVVSPGMTLAIGQAVPASHEELKAVPELDPMQPAASYTLDFSTSHDVPTSSSPSQSQVKAASPRQTDDFASFGAPAVSQDHTTQPFVRKPRPPSLEMPAPQEDISIAASPFGVSDELRLSDEFFLKEGDLFPRKRNRVVSFLFWSFIGVFFAGIGFLGMAMYARHQQGQNPWPFSADTDTKLPNPPKRLKQQTPRTPTPRVLVKQPTTPRVGTTPANLTTTPDGGEPSTAPRTVPPVDRRDVTPPVRGPNDRTEPVQRRVVEPSRRAPVVVRRAAPIRRAPVVVRRRKPVRIARRTRPPVRRQRPARGNSQQKAQALYRKAMALKRRERFRNAERLLRRALKLRPKRPAVIYSALGQVLYEREKTRSAVRYLTRAYRISPRQTGAGLVTLGSIYYERGKRARARTIYRQYLKFYPRGRHADDVKAMLRN